MNCWLQTSKESPQKAFSPVKKDLNWFYRDGKPLGTYLLTSFSSKVSPNILEINSFRLYDWLADGVSLWLGEKSMAGRQLLSIVLVVEGIPQNLALHAAWQMATLAMARTHIPLQRHIPTWSLLHPVNSPLHNSCGKHTPTPATPYTCLIHAT